MTIHAEVKAEVLEILEQATDWLSRSEIFDRCDIATDPQQVSLVLSGLKSAGKVERRTTESNKRSAGTWRLASKLVEEAVKTSTETDAAPAPCDGQTGSEMDIPTLTDSHDPVRAALAELAAGIPDAEYRAGILRELAGHRLTRGHPELSRFFTALAADIEDAA